MEIEVDVQYKDGRIETITLPVGGDSGYFTFPGDGTIIATRPPLLNKWLRGAMGDEPLG